MPSSSVGAKVDDNQLTDNENKINIGAIIDKSLPDVISVVNTKIPLELFSKARINFVRFLNDMISIIKQYFFLNSMFRHDLTAVNKLIEKVIRMYELHISGKNSSWSVVIQVSFIKKEGKMRKFKCECGGEIVNQECNKCNIQLEPIIDEVPSGNFAQKKEKKEESTIISYI